MGNRRRLGITLHISKSSGNLILRAEDDVRIGYTVLDGSGSRVGVVFDLFGPVSGPFVSVKPRVPDPGRYVGRPLFLKGSRR